MDFIPRSGRREENGSVGCLVCFSSIMLFVHGEAASLYFVRNARLGEAKALFGKLDMEMLCFLPSCVVSPDVSPSPYAYAAPHPAV